MSKFNSRKWYVALFIMALTGVITGFVIGYVKCPEISPERIKILSNIIYWGIGFLAAYCGINVFQKFIPELPKKEVK